MCLILSTAFPFLLHNGLMHVNKICSKPHPVEAGAKLTSLRYSWEPHFVLIIYGHFSGNWCWVGMCWGRGGLGCFNHCQMRNSGQLSEIYPLSSTGAVKIDLWNALTRGESSCRSWKQPCKYPFTQSKELFLMGKSGRKPIFILRSSATDVESKLEKQFYLCRDHHSLIRITSVSCTYFYDFTHHQFAHLFPFQALISSMGTGVMPKEAPGM